MFGDLKNLKLVNPNLKLLVPQASLVIILILLFVFLFKNGYAKINSQFEEIRKAKETEKLLSEKASVLTDVQQNVLGYTEKIALALPDKNPATWVISQVRKGVDDNSLVLSNVELRQLKTDGELSNMELEIEVKAGADKLTNILSFIQYLDDFAPLTQPKEIKIEEPKDEEITTTVVLVIFWSEFPTKLPPLNQPVSEISFNEQELLNRISSLKSPEFTMLPPQPATERVTPFD